MMINLVLHAQINETQKKMKYCGWVKKANCVCAYVCALCSLPFKRKGLPQYIVNILICQDVFTDYVHGSLI